MIFPEINLIFPKNCVIYNIEIYKYCELKQIWCGICAYMTRISVCAVMHRKEGLYGYKIY